MRRWDTGHKVALLHREHWLSSDLWVEGERLEQTPPGGGVQAWGRAGRGSRVGAFQSVAARRQIENHILIPSMSFSIFVRAWWFSDDGWGDVSGLG